MIRKIAFSIILSVLSLAAAAQEQPANMCTVCQGGATLKCPLCKGKGKWKMEVNGKSKKEDCPACQGEGVQRCWLCDATGRDREVVKPQTSVDHPEGYYWLWCGKCHHHGVTACARCGGIGKLYTPQGESMECTLCRGLRYMNCDSCNGTCGHYVTKARCTLCEGNGVLTCDRCNGQGWLPPLKQEPAYAQVCKSCKATGMVPHKDCQGTGCKNCKDGKVGCGKCEGRGAIIVGKVAEKRPCSHCSNKGVVSCSNCFGRGYKSLTAEGLVQ